ncbi:MAG TPA: hypothetical protein VID68_12510 [Solirubrobacteraceae bacterium]
MAERGERHADRHPVRHGERRERSARDVLERGEDALGLVAKRLSAGERKVWIGAHERRVGGRILRRDVVMGAVGPQAAVRLN